MQPPLQIDLKLSRFLYFLCKLCLQALFFNKLLHSHKTKFVAFLSVRTGWDALLSSLCLPRSSEVLMSCVNIPGMRDIIIHNNLTPKYLDLDPQTMLPSIEEVQNKITDKTRVLLISHLFGAWSSIQPIAQICKQKNIILVEDCAEAFLGNDFHGTPEADITFFSFGTIKRSTAGGGAVAFIRGETLKEHISKVINSYPRQNNFLFLKKLGKILFLKLFTTKLLYGALVFIINLFNQPHDELTRNWVRGFPPGNAMLIAIRKQICTSLAIFLEISFNSSNLNYWEKRNKNIKNYIEKSCLPPELIPGFSNQYYSFWLFPVLANNSTELVTELRHKGFDATKGITSLIDLSNNPNSNANKILQKIVYLPIVQSNDLNYLSEMLQICAAKIN